MSTPLIGNGTNNTNQGKVLWWILGGILGPMILALVNTVQTTSNRVTGLEAEFKEIRRNLDSIDHKLDRINERK